MGGARWVVGMGMVRFSWFPLLIGPGCYLHVQEKAKVYAQLRLTSKQQGHFDAVGIV